MSESINPTSCQTSDDQRPSTVGERVAPATDEQRIDSLDVVRGFALCGILMVNIQSFAMIDAALFNPTATGEIGWSDYLAWLFTHLLFEMKFMTIFSALFGAGIVLMWEKSKKAGRTGTGLHYRRMFWLLLFGLAHAHLIWYGDILFLYAVCGMLVYWLCGLRARWLIPIGLILISVGTFNSVMSGLSLPYWEEEQLLDLQGDWSSTDEQIATQLAIYRGSWIEQMPHRVETSLFMQTFLVAFWGLWRAGGLMLVGMGLFKLGFFSAKWSRRHYVTGATIGLLAGFSIVGTGVYYSNASDWSFEYCFFFGNQWNYWGSLFVSFGYVCLWMLACKRESGGSSLLDGLQLRLSRVGQMALTNYLTHSIVGTLIFYGHGLGWFGYLSRLQLIGIVLAIWTFQLWFSPLWLARFRFGPFEWLWRSLSYWCFQPMRRPTQ